MRRIATLLSIAPIAIAIAMAGCDNSQNLTSPQTKISSQFAANGGPHRVVATVTEGTSSTVIDSKGGSIRIVDPTGELVALLTVPAGTVKHNTTFAMNVSVDYTISLTATSAGGVTNDIGSAGFAKGVTLSFNPKFMRTLATGILGVAQTLDNHLYPVNSTLVNGLLVGTLMHFSDYVPTEDCCYGPIVD